MLYFEKCEFKKRVGFFCLRSDCNVPGNPFDCRKKIKENSYIHEDLLLMIYTENFSVKVRALLRLDGLFSPNKPYQPLNAIAIKDTEIIKQCHNCNVSSYFVRQTFALHGVDVGLADNLLIAANIGIFERVTPSFLQRYVFILKLVNIPGVEANPSHR